MGFLSPFRKRSADDPPPTESWPLFAFGKLPVYKDFISAGLTDDVSREFRDWLSNGFSRHWSSRDDCRSTEIPLHAFLLRLPESRKMAVGALWGSTDQGGLRKFPFALFTILPAGKPAASVLTALDYLPVFESRAREIRRKYDAGGSLAAVYQELRGARIEIPVRTEEQIRARLAEALARSRVGPLATALFGRRRGDAMGRSPLRPRRGRPKPHRGSGGVPPSARRRDGPASSDEALDRQAHEGLAGGSRSDRRSLPDRRRGALRRDFLPRRESGRHPPLSSGGDSDRFRRGDSETRPTDIGGRGGRTEAGGRRPGDESAGRHRTVIRTGDDERRDSRSAGHLTGGNRAAG